VEVREQRQCVENDGRVRPVSAAEVAEVEFGDVTSKLATKAEPELARLEVRRLESLEKVMDRA
jgi:hypothetical protein